MTPFARRIMEKVREKEHGSYEAWFQAIVDEVLRETAAVADKQAWAHGGKYFEGPELNCTAIAAAIRSLMQQEPRT